MAYLTGFRDNGWAYGFYTGCNAGERETRLAELVRFLKRQRVIAEYGADQRRDAGLH